MTDRKPAPLLLAVVVAVLQVVVGALATVLGLLLAVASSASDRADAASGSPNPWSGFGVAIGAAAGVAGLATAVLVGVPLLVLRGRSATRRVTGRGLLIGGELLLLLPLLVFTHARFRTLVVVPTDPFSLAFDALLLIPVVVVVGLLVPSSGRWTLAGTAAP